MNNRTKSAVWPPFIFRVAPRESAHLHGFVSASAYGAIYLLKLFNKHVAMPTAREAIRALMLNNLKKLRNLSAPMALTAPWTERKEDL